MNTISSMEQAAPAGSTGRIALCDSETGYMHRLADYLMETEAVPCGISLYSSGASLLEHCRPGDLSLLVIAQSQYTGAVREAGFSSVLILNEEECYMEEDSISKYQAVENIAAGIRERCAADTHFSPGSMRHGAPMRRIGVYSPLTRCLQTTFSLCLGQILAREARTLYLNFEAWSGLGVLLEKNYRASVSDLLYYNECAREKMAAQISLMTEKIGALHYIPPMESFLQMRSIRQQEWLSLLDTIEQVTEYRYLILDLTEHTDGLFDILKGCDVVYTIEREDGFSKAKMLRYEEMLREMHCEEILLRMKKFRMPVFRTLPPRLDMLTRGELAAFVEKLAAEEKLFDTGKGGKP
ncbi:MAG: hypothetical protein IJG52_07985 [Lachnospiraceae bacterium]|nr:hypothetical protein [Lachnospiraceae bacterium]